MNHTLVEGVIYRLCLRQRIENLHLKVNATLSRLHLDGPGHVYKFLAQEVGNWSELNLQRFLLYFLVLDLARYGEAHQLRGAPDYLQPLTTLAELLVRNDRTLVHFILSAASLTDRGVKLAFQDQAQVDHWCQRCELLQTEGRAHLLLLGTPTILFLL